MNNFIKSQNLYLCLSECIVEKDNKFLVIKRPLGV